MSLLAPQQASQVAASALPLCFIIALLLLQSSYAYPKRFNGHYTIDTAEVAQHCEVRGQYEQSYQGAPACVRYLENETFYVPSPRIGERRMLFHLFWRGPMIPVMQISVKSFLYTQISPNDIQPAQMWVWLDPSNKNGPPYFKSEDLDTDGFLPFKTVSERLGHNGQPLPAYFNCACIRFRLLNVPMLMSQLPHKIFPPAFMGNMTVNQQTLYDLLFKLLKPGEADSSPLSDLSRWVILYLYGGVYVDADVLLLRDFRPFQHFDWAHRWSRYEWCNTAVMHGLQHSPALERVMKVMLASAPPTASAWAGIFYPTSSCLMPHPHTHVTGERLFVFPVQLFDITWLQRDNYTPGGWDGLPNWQGFLGRDQGPPPGTTVADWPGGVVAYHWHNEWHNPIVDGTWAKVFDDAMNAFLTGSGPNIYGELFNVGERCAATLQHRHRHQERRARRSRRMAR